MLKIALCPFVAIQYDGNLLSTSCGSPNSAAPEIINGDHYVGPEVDVWSCGVMLYAMLCGALPFDEESIPALYSKIRTGRYRTPSHVSSLARNLIERMLTVDPLQRITLPEIHNHPWFRTNLPQYLMSFEDNDLKMSPHLDLDIVQRVSDVIGHGISPAAVVSAISSKFPQTRAVRDICVTFKFFLEQKQLSKRIADISSIRSNFEGEPQEHPPSGCTEMIAEIRMNPKR